MISTKGVSIYYTRRGWGYTAMRRVLRALALFYVLALLGCSTPLLNINTLDLAGTLSDVSIRQIVYNLARTAQNMWFVPSQVQLNNGIIAARTNIAPSYSTPFNSAVFNTTAIARAATTTSTSTFETMASPPTGTLSATAEDTSTWNVSPIQDPEQLKRLQLLYQYGVGKIDASDLLCLYPIPEKSEDAAGKSDLDSKTKTPQSKKYYIRGQYSKSRSRKFGFRNKGVAWSSVGA
jgi:hypothetical protein